MKVTHFPDINFIGMSKTSPSGEWLIAWSEGSNRDSLDGKGSYVLYNNKLNKIFLHKKMERPGKAAVSDNGSFCIENWQFSQEQTGIFLAFSSRGKQLICRKFKANIRSSAISNNGLYAICSTASNNKGNDGNKITAFNLMNKCEIFSVPSSILPVTHYKFNEELAEFIIVAGEIGEYRYNSTGEIFDSAELISAFLAAEDFTAIINEAEVTLKNDIKNYQIEDVLASIDRARHLGADKYPFWKLKALKLQGTIYLKIKNEELALKYFEEAFNIDPKCGVKKKNGFIKKEKYEWPKHRQITPHYFPAQDFQIYT